LAFPADYLYLTDFHCYFKYNSSTANLSRYPSI